jgi:hypothetical protein
MNLRAYLPALLLLSGFAGCALAPLAGRGLHHQQQEFFDELRALCGQSFAGESIEAPAGDTLYTGRRMVMEVRECSEERVVIPVRVGEDRSRTWVVTRGENALSLTHIHRHDDGTEDDNSRYGGFTVTPGERWRQDFPADSFSVRMVPGRATQTWTLEIRPGHLLDYSLHRTATDLRYRFRFDLSRPL